MRRRRVGWAAVAAVSAVSACGVPAEAANSGTSAPVAVGEMVRMSPMHHARATHSATTLGGGRILIVGGMGSTPRAPAELYSDELGQFTEISGPAVARSSHTATLLDDGQVLVAGGYGADGSYLRSVERFDPASGLWHAAGQLHDARAGHVAVPLLDGRVLMVGGVGTGWTFLASAEIYDPATEASTPTASMAVPRESHVAVGMPDGSVLVVGGHAGRRAQLVLYASVERFDPATGTFEPAGQMLEPRHKHEAILLKDGTVLVLGGADRRDSRGQLQSVERYDPASEQFTPMAALTRSRYKHAGTARLVGDGAVLLTGGAGAAELYDAKSGRSVSVPGESTMPGLFSATAPLPGGRVLVTGGYGGDIASSSGAWQYRP